jgi:hypothetical protein
LTWLSAEPKENPQHAPIKKRRNFNSSAAFWWQVEKHEWDREMGYYLLLSRDLDDPDQGFRVCGTYRDDGGDRAALNGSEAHAVVDAEDFFRAQQPGSCADRGLFRM